MGSRPRIGIIGKGNMGAAFASGLQKAGYSVESAGHHPSEVREVVRGSEVVIVAVPFVAIPGLLPEIAGSVEGRIVVDITNLLGPNFTFLGELATSGAERMQAALPGARVVKAFNTVFSAYLDGGTLNGETLTAFLAGDDVGAKSVVADMARGLGLDPVDVGPLRASVWLEVVGYFNIQVHESIGWDHALRLLRGKGE